MPPQENEPQNQNTPAQPVQPQQPAPSAIPQIRTFHDDMARAKGKNPETHILDTNTPATEAPAQSLQEKISGVANEAIKQQSEAQAQIEAIQRESALTVEAPAETLQDVEKSAKRLSNIAAKQKQPIPAAAQQPRRYIPYMPKRSPDVAMHMQSGAPQMPPPQSLADLKSRPGYAGTAHTNVKQEPKFKAPKPIEPKKNILNTILAAAKSKKRGLSTVQTYDDTLTQTIKEGNKSVISIALDEEKKRARQATRLGTPIAPRSDIWIVAIRVLIILLLVVGGGGLLYYGYTWFTQADDPVPITFESGALFFPENEKEVTLESLRPNTLADLVERSLIAEGDATHVYVTKIDPTVTDFNKIVLPAQEFLTLITPNIPNTLARALQDRYMFGIYNDRQNQPFLILKLNSFEIGFAEMLNWEKTLQADLKPLFGDIEPFVRISNDPNVSEGEEPLSIEEVVQIDTKAFKDAVIRNRDARVIHDPIGNSVFLYAFIDDETLIITTTETTFLEIINRLNTAQFKR